VKKSKREDIDIELAAKFVEQYPELARKVFSRPAPDAVARRKTRRRKQPKTRESSIVDRLEKEIGDYETGQYVRRFQDYILEPPPELSWTKDLVGYEDARLSAENAMRKIKHLITFVWQSHCWQRFKAATVHHVLKNFRVY